MNKQYKISSKNMYDLVRDYIKLNIDPKYATITSDCDFCFGVKKTLKLFDPIKYVTLSNLKTSYKQELNVVCFEMTHDREKYKGYTIIDGLTADSERELLEKIDNYLEEIMAVINSPLELCQHCKGTGVKKVGT
jgi:hypothetical protein